MALFEIIKKNKNIFTDIRQKLTERKFCEKHYTCLLKYEITGNFHFYSEIDLFLFFVLVTYSLCPFSVLTIYHRISFILSYSFKKVNRHSGKGTFRSRKSAYTRN